MITDISMDPSIGRFVLSADRDEKIRISQFPPTALIQSYCLGHASAVVQVACCQRFQAENWMISIPKDGTIKFWDYLKSTMLDSKTLCDSENTQSGVHTLAMCPFTVYRSHHGRPLCLAEENHVGKSTSNIKNICRQHVHIAVRVSRHRE